MNKNDEEAVVISKNDELSRLKIEIIGFWRTKEEENQINTHALSERNPEKDNKFGIGI